MPTAATSTLDLDHLLSVLTALKNGDFSVRMPETQTVSPEREIVSTLNALVDQGRTLCSEITRVSTSAAEGRFDDRVDADELGGAWKEAAGELNWANRRLAGHMRGVTGAVETLARG